MAFPVHTKLSARNLRRQIFSEVASLDGEDSDAFDQLHESLARVFQPADALEKELVEVAAIAQWRLQRLHHRENALSGHEVRLNRNLQNTLALLHAAKRSNRSEAGQ